MRVSEISGRFRHEVRRVGVTFAPTEMHKVMAAAMDLYRELETDVEVEGLTVFVRCGRGIAPAMMGMLERRTGRVGFNEWETRDADADGRAL